MIRTRAVRAAALVAALSSVGCGPGADGRPHIVLVTVDTLRADHLSLNGYERETSPHVDAFARAAWHFPDATAVLPKTGPSVTTHLSGLHPCEHQVTANRIRIPGEVPLLAERLKTAGYRTAAFVSNPVLSRPKGYARGFDVYREFTKEGGLEDLNRRFLRWAAKDGWDTPTFVWIHYIDPHGPYTPPGEYEDLFTSDELFRGETRTLPATYEPLRGWPVSYCLGAIPRYQVRGEEDRVAAYVAWYDAEIRTMDDAFGDVVGFLKEEGLFDAATILFTADHGESLGEHDYWFEHGWYAYEATSRIPMIVKPAGVTEGRVIEGQVTNLDTAPTLLAAAGLAPAAELRGRNLLEPLADDGPVLVLNTSTYPDRYVGVRTSRYKLLRELNTGREELYDLSADPREERNLVEELPEVAGPLRGALAQRLRECAGRVRGEAVEVRPGAEAARELEALGYTGE